ncbi:hypothetical protein FRB95_013540 [Tulasnella sp. JGI-2019a]|nr:hypothetical protein FRB93_008255 [Tulasnella sp. JGI-2019a]KAG9034258.1 hypothetical protein FRB95_013540 [Tulasnella sp. JGI-2019a]
MVAPSRIALALISAALSAVALPASNTGAICLVIPLGSPAITTAPSLSGLQLTNTGGVATLTTHGYSETFSFAGGGFGAFSACSDYWLDIGPLSTTIPNARTLTWALDTATTPKTTTWKAAYNSTLTALAGTYPETSTFYACAPNTASSSATPEPTLYLPTALILNPFDGTPVAPTVSGLKCVVTTIFIEPLPFVG